MFRFLKKKSKTMSGAELAEEGLRQIAIAIQNNSISLQQGRVCEDIYAHADRPNGNPRFTYVMFSPTVQNQVVGRCVILLDRLQGQMPIWQMDWAVLGQYRNQGYGLAIAAKALIEFTNGMKGKLGHGYAIEAVVDQCNEPSVKIARAILGGEQVLSNKEGDTPVHSFLKQFA
ncbi:hypothetical protein WYI_23495 [Ochrobactrum sp. CDB2]|nr:hypothetical protein WYI_23495 [Ochrobactrum sp. CDB2]